MVSDLETGKPRGFAFVEFEDPQAALSAIRNMSDYELNGRRLRVNFSNSSHLETLAGQLGMDMSKKDANVSINPSIPAAPGAMNTAGQGNMGMGMGMGMNADVGTQAVANALKNMSKGEMYDVVAKLKQIADGDPDEARKIISGHPQLPEALLFLMSQLDMIKTPLPNGMGNVGVGVGVGVPAPPPMNVPVPPRPPPVMEQAVRKDPRARQDPRARHDPRQQPPVAPPPPYMGQPPPGPPPKPPTMGVAGLDPALVQQVMGLTPEQIQQLPVEKQASIMALRQQITNAMAGR